MRHLSDEQREIYNWGAQDALRFKSGSHLINQDVFKCETADHNLWIGYDDVTGIYYLEVNFKERYRGDNRVHVCLEFSDHRTAMARALRFIAEHPAPRPHCDVDY